MIKFIKTLLKKPLAVMESEYIIVHIETYTKQWSDSNPRSMSLIFKQNAEGKRRVDKEGSIYPADIENEKWWHDAVVPWLNGYIKPEEPEVKKKNVVKLELVKK